MGGVERFTIVVAFIVGHTLLVCGEASEVMLGPVQTVSDLISGRSLRAPLSFEDDDLHGTEEQRRWSAENIVREPKYEFLESELDLFEFSNMDKKENALFSQDCLNEDEAMRYLACKKFEATSLNLFRTCRTRVRKSYMNRISATGEEPCTMLSTNNNP
mmetsp:Transcript_22408/g.43967  ORF Transcript_22408/g.43967 Transcript_22408/m.43967 type:complete len:159 (+) Transcript_22408:131-607(+)